MGKIEKIRLKNFKSFKNVSIPVSVGHTTIVGPNGSGKSNILDAMCFVLGSTSMKTLRAAKLADLVNHDSKTGTAEVTLCMRDSGGEAYEVARSIDGKGQSVFRLNGKRTTMKQIDDLMSSMGVHSEGHNIIMQGDVTRLIKMTPQQRRQILDEISGIADYEEKKNEALKELEKVQAKIKEAEIVMGERRSYLKVLESERKEAQKYQNMQEERKSHKATLTRIELDRIEKQFNKMVEKMNATREEIEALEADKEGLLSAMRGLEKEHNEITERIFKEGDKRQADVNAQIEQIKGSIAMLDGRIKAKREVMESQNMRKAELLKKFSDIGNQIAKKEKELEKISEDSDEVKRDLVSTKKALERLGANTDEYGKKMDELYASLDEVNIEVEKSKEDIYRLDSASKTLSERINLKKAMIKDHDTESSKKKDRLSMIRAQIANYGDSKLKLEKSLDKAASGLRELYRLEKEKNAEHSQKEQKLSELMQRKAALESKISVMKSISGMAETAKEVAESGIKGIIGAVADLCNYGQKYARAIETSAGPRMFYIVTETTDDAIEAVKYLKAKKLGRATFIPLDRIRPQDVHPETEKLRKKAEVLDLAVNLISYDKRYEKAMKYVFGDTLVITDIGAMKKVGVGKARMVSLDGDLSTQHGVISGGHTKGAGISDVKQLDELRKLADDYGNAKRMLLREIEELREKEANLRSEHTRLELDLKENEVMLKEWKRRLDEHGDLLKEGEQSSVSTLKEIRAMEEAMMEKDKEKEKLQKALDRLIEKRSAMKAKAASIEDSDSAKKIRELKAEYESLREKQADAEVQKKTLQGEIERVLLKNREEAKLQIGEIERHLSKLEAEKESDVKERDGLMLAQKEKELQARQLATSMTDLYDRKNSIDQKRSELNDTIAMAERKREKAMDKLGEMKIEKAGIEGNYFNLRNQWNNCKGIEQVAGQSEEQIRRRLVVIEEELTGMGYVNMKAIEKYDEYMAEVREIEAKSKRLNDERESIVLMMNEIEKKKVASFIKTFEAINANFDKYFREFYPEEGSHASISLDEMEKPLDSGLILAASPAGKRVKSIEAMSGGEKSVTALAFLFAIQAYNPSPFYVLDEVDAALDPSNSQRVARMIRKFSKDTQIITITHNRYVINEAEQIIGVHAGKDGSSAVEVDLKSYADAVTKTGTAGA